MLPFAQAAVEYGALASRGGLSRLASDAADALSSPSPELAAWIAAAVAIVLLATRRRGALAYVLLLAGGAVIAARALDLW